MQDLTTEFATLASCKRRRDSAETEALVRKVCDVLHGSVDWDTDAGEDWASVLDDEPSLTALVYAEAPLVVCRDASMVRGATPTGVTIVEVEDFDSPVLTAERRSIVNLFGPGAGQSELETSKFSANDLWFWTI